MNKRLHVLSVYNAPLGTSTTTHHAPVGTDNSYTIQIIILPPKEWPTLVTKLDQLSTINEFISDFDINLYRRVLKVEHLDSQYKNKWVVCPGAFHTSLCALICPGSTIGRMFIEAGLEQIYTVLLL